MSEEVVIHIESNEEKKPIPKRGRSHARRSSFHRASSLKRDGSISRLGRHSISKKDLSSESIENKAKEILAAASAAPLDHKKESKKESIIKPELSDAEIYAKTQQIINILKTYIKTDAVKIFCPREINVEIDIGYNYRIDKLCEELDNEIIRHSIIDTLKSQNIISQIKSISSHKISVQNNKKYVSSYYIECQGNSHSCCIIV